MTVAVGRHLHSNTSTAKQQQLVSHACMLLCSRLPDDAATAAQCHMLSWWLQLRHSISDAVIYGVAQTGRVINTFIAQRAA
jgi:hypothetical protein